MRTTRSLLALLALTVLTLSACAGTLPPPGASAGSPGATSANQGGPAVAGATVKSRIEQAAKVVLEEQPGADSDSTVYANLTTVATDGQFVAVIVAADAQTVKIVADAMKAGFAAFGQLKTYTNKNVIVMYAAAGGTDNSAAVEAAVNGL